MYKYLCLIILGILIFILWNRYNVEKFIGDYYLVGYENDDRSNRIFKLILADSLDDYLIKIFNTQENPTNPGSRPNDLSPFSIYGYMGIDWNDLLQNGTITILENDSDQVIDLTNDGKTQQELMDDIRDLINNHFGLTTTQFGEFGDRPNLNPSVVSLFHDATFGEFDWQPISFNSNMGDLNDAQRTYLLGLGFNNNFETPTTDRLSQDDRVWLMRNGFDRDWIEVIIIILASSEPAPAPAAGGRVCAAGRGGGGGGGRGARDFFTQVALPDFIKNLLDLYKLGISILYKPQNNTPELIRTAVTDKIDIIEQKNFSIQSLTTVVELSDYTSLSKPPMILHLRYIPNNTYINYLILTFSAVNTFHYFCRIVRDIIISLTTIYGDRLDADQTPLVIVGHSAGSGCLLVLVNELYRINPNFNIQTCVTMGFGLCDSYTVDNFERNVMTKNIDYYDIWNYDNLDYGKLDCVYDKVGDNRLIKRTVQCTVCTHMPENFCSYSYGLLNLNLSIYLSNTYHHFDQQVRDIISRLEDGRLDGGILLPPDYLDYYRQKLQDFTSDMYTSCIDRINCTQFLELFHKHVSMNTLALFEGTINTYSKRTYLIDQLRTQRLRKSTISDIEMIFDPNRLDDFVCLDEDSHILKNGYTDKIIVL